MIRPVNFSFNAETAVNNAFQVDVAGEDAHGKALAEFDNFVSVLRDNDIDVTVIDDTPEPFTPDSIFPNNWISFHSEGTACLYPMYAHNRRMERKPAVMAFIGQKFRIDTMIDFSHYEEKGIFLEGTGSMVLDRENHIAYACLSPRTNRTILLDFCSQMGYRPEVFTAVDGAGQEIYHTNVMMCIGDRFAVVCFDSLPVAAEREHLAAVIRASGKTIIPISLQQLNHFAGNMLQVENRHGEKLLVMSTQAFASLNPGQLKDLEAFSRIVHAPLETIETNGGGSARCMLAEVHLLPR